ncbi:MAG: hypothetical protein H0U49_09535 [Parachlamydiaceae bacterium]|nr:hypothetical protein [Parachlamydiaceae bacterium]
MTFIEMIGFIISLGALFVLAAKKAFDERRRRANPEEYEREEKAQAEKLKAFLHSIDMDMDESEGFEPEPIPRKKPKSIVKAPPKVQQLAVNRGRIDGQVENRKLESGIENRKLNVSVEKQKLKSRIDDYYKIPMGPSNATGIHEQRQLDAYNIKKTGNNKTNRALDILTGLKSRKDMVILQEIIAPPKSLRE